MAKKHGNLADDISGNILITKVEGGLNIESLSDHEEFYFNQIPKVAGKDWGIYLELKPESIGTPDTMKRVKHEFIWAFKGGCVAVAVVCSSQFVLDVMKNLIGDIGYQFECFDSESDGMAWLKQNTED